MYCTRDYLPFVLLLNHVEALESHATQEEKLKIKTETFRHIILKSNYHTKLLTLESQAITLLY